MSRQLTLKEARELGILQEVNRQFFHPLGLALTSDDCGDDEFYIQDFRNHPEGVLFDEGMDLRPKWITYQLFESDRFTSRGKELGFIYQDPDPKNPLA